MVSDDAEVLVTDFGFAAVGTFGPPPQTVQETSAVPAYATTGSNKVEVDSLQKASTGRHPGDRAIPSGTPQGGVGASRGDDKGSSEKMLNSNKGSRPHSKAMPDGSGKYSTSNSWCDNMEEAMGASDSTIGVKIASGILTPTNEEECTASVCPSAEAKRVSARVIKRGQAETVIEQTGVRYPPVGGDGDAEEGNRARPETANLRQQNGGNSTPPHPESVLVGSLKGYTPRYQSPEVSAIIEEKCHAAKVAMAREGAVVSEGEVSQVSVCHSLTAWGGLSLIVTP